MSRTYTGWIGRETYKIFTSGRKFTENGVANVPVLFRSKDHPELSEERERPPVKVRFTLEEVQ